VALSDEERRGGQVTAGSLLAISSALDACGVVAVEGLYTERTIDRVREAQQEHFMNLNHTALEAPGAVQRVKRRASAARAAGDSKYASSEFDDMAVRGDRRRVEATLPLAEPFRGVVEAAPILSIVEHCLRDGELELDTHSYVHSEPGSRHQPWHRDVDYLHAAASASATATAAQQTPAHGVVSVVPLVDLDGTNGATEFVVGSHLHPSAIDKPAEFWNNLGGGGDADSELLVTAQFLVPRGSALLFDLRTTHRGGPNASPSPRAVMYSSYVLEWFRDAVNFTPRQSAQWGRMRPSRTRKLFSRVDAREYTKTLERLLAERGVDIAELAHTPY
jgi:ectoine hydroxylase-related dioxygenase (phytanoyl-CoA dioxygenase family)